MFRTLQESILKLFESGIQNVTYVLYCSVRLPSNLDMLVNNMMFTGPLYQKKGTAFTLLDYLRQLACPELHSPISDLTILRLQTSLIFKLLNVDLKPEERTV